MTRYLQMAGREPAARYDYAAKGAQMATTMRVLRAFDALGLCHFCLLIGEPPFLAWLRAATGWDADDGELFRTGRRIQALRHAFNAREGITPGQVTLPGRERGDPPPEVGPLAGVTLDEETMTRSYFEAMGIDAATGWPLPETAADLELDSMPDWPSPSQEQSAGTD
jgi:aldehyde:ferredoxin oxidoreductase